MKKENKIKPIKAYWIRKLDEEFLISNVYMNKQNAKLVCSGRNLQRDGSFSKLHKVIPVLITIHEPIGSVVKRLSITKKK